jgi:hypothetical protein|tara:strand:- start:498 stop:695 length:198 start_codon:yes stop_codon:yes gene_type:complete
MSHYKLTEFPVSDRRESQYKLEQLISHISGAGEMDNFRDAYLEMMLCLANEIEDLKNHNKLNKTK